MKQRRVRIQFKGRKRDDWMDLEREGNAVHEIPIHPGETAEEVDCGEAVRECLEGILVYPGDMIRVMPAEEGATAAAGDESPSAAAGHTSGAGTDSSAEGDDVDDDECRTCGEPYSGWGDGWDCECPGCADRTYLRETEGGDGEAASAAA